jgi:hypothetical protein
VKWCEQPDVLIDDLVASDRTLGVIEETAKAIVQKPLSCVDDGMTRGTLWSVFGRVCSMCDSGH